MRGLNPADLAGAAPLDEDAPSGPGGLEATLRGLKQGATFGFGDELTGALEHVLTGKDYKQARDEARASDKAAKSAHPWLYGAGEVGGGLATAVVPGGGIVRGAGLAANIARGAGAGIAAGIGNSEAEDVGGIAKDAAIGGLAGGAVGGIAGHVSDKLLGGAVKRAENADLAGLKEGLQYSTALKTFGKSTPSAPEGQWTAGIKAALKDEPGIKRAIAKEPSRALQMVDQKLGHLTDRLEAIYEKASEASGKGVPLGTVTGRADEGQAAATGLAKLEAQWGRTVATEPQAELVRNVIAKLETRSAGGTLDSSPGHISLGDLRAEYRAWQDIANRANKVFSSKSPREEVAEDIANSLRETLQQHVAEVAEKNPGLGIGKKLLQDTNKEVSSWIRVQNALTQKATRENLNIAPMGDVIKGVNALRHPVKAIGGAVASTAGKPVDAALAKLTIAAQNGDRTSAMVLRALGAGGPRGLSEGVSAATTPDQQEPEPAY